jgi:hypothetical protein
MDKNATKPQKRKKIRIIEIKPMKKTKISGLTIKNRFKKV